jgi:hypothetical protein
VTGAEHPLAYGECLLEQVPCLGEPAQVLGEPAMTSTICLPSFGSWTFASTFSLALGLRPLQE